MTFEQFVNRVSALAAEGRLPMEALALLSTRKTGAWPAGLALTDDYAPYDLLIGRAVDDGGPSPTGSSQ